jgi:hypothetical protein
VGPYHHPNPGNEENALDIAETETEPESAPQFVPQHDQAASVPLQDEVMPHATGGDVPISQRSALSMKLMEVFADNHSRPFGELLMNTILDIIARNGVDIPGDKASLRTECAIDESSTIIDEMRVAACGNCQLVVATADDGSATTCTCLNP